MTITFKIYFITFFSFWLNNTFSQNVFDINIPGTYFRTFAISQDSSFVAYTPDLSTFSNGGIFYKINKFGMVTDSIYNNQFQTMGINNTILNVEDGYFIIGETYKDIIDDGLGRDIIIEKIDYNGNIVKQIPLEGVWMQDAVNSSDGNILVLAEILEQPTMGFKDIILYKIDNDGNILWKTLIGKQFKGIYDETYSESAISITEIENNYYLSYTNYKNLSSIAYLTKLNETGALQWTIEDKFNSLALKTITGVFKLNNEFYFVNNDDYKVFKFNNSNGIFKSINKKIQTVKYGGDYNLYTTKCNNLTLCMNVNNQIYFTQYVNIDTFYNSKITNFADLSLIKNTPDGGYAILSTNGRLIKTDCKGNYTFWDDECTNRLKANQEVLMYPNPTTGILNIETNFDIRKIIVLDNIGKQIIYHNYCNCGKQQIDVSAYSQGAYFLKIVGTDGFEVERFVKY